MSLQPVGSTPSPAANARHDAYLMRQGDPAGSLTSNKEAAKSMKALLKKSKVQYTHMHTWWTLVCVECVHVLIIYGYT